MSYEPHQDVRFGIRLKACAFTAAFISAAAVADGWTWAGKTGDVTVPAGVTAQVTDADTSVLEGLTGIALGEGALLEFVNANNPVNLSAKLSGEGAVRSCNAAAITLAGDNISHMGPMEFTNTTVYVTSRTGLGNPSRGIYHGPASYKVQLADETTETVLTPLQFRGNGLTNDVPIVFRGSRESAGKYFTATLADPWVQNGPLAYCKNTGDVVTMYLGDYIIAGGITNATSTWEFRVAAGRTCVIKDKPLSVRYNRVTYVELGRDSTLTLDAAGNQWNDESNFYGSGRILCGRNGVINIDRTLRLAINTSCTTFDMNGKDQTFSKLINAKRLYDKTGSSVPTKGSAGYALVTSATPALLKLTTGGNYQAAVQFSGKVSHTHTGAGTYTIINRYSDTTGSLQVSNGAVKFDWGAGWGGKIVLTETGKVIFAEQCPQNLYSQNEVNISNEGQFVVSNGVVFTCAKLVIGGKVMPEGDYTAADLPNQIKGEGVLRVKTVPAYADEDVFTWSGGGSGWSDPANWGGTAAPGVGDKAVIPAGATVVVTDADVDYVEAMSAIEIAEGGRVDFANLTKPVSVSGCISGGGAIASHGSAGITLGGDNFFHWGSMEFTNTPVYVTSRTGLGSPSRRIVHWGSGNDENGYFPLRFRGAGLTNDVDIGYVGSAKTPGQYFTDSLEDPWVQNGCLDYIAMGHTPEVYLGDYILNGAYRADNSSVTFGIRGGRTLTISGTPMFLHAENRWTVFRFDPGASLRLAVAGNKWMDRMTFIGGGTLVCDVEDALDVSSALNVGAAESRTYLDLNGHDQKCKWFRNAAAPVYTTSTKAYVPTRGSYGHAVVMSASSARLTAATPEDVTVTNAVIFTQMAGFGHIGGGRTMIVNRYSDTSNSLSVEDGTVEFTWGAGWGGDIDVSGNGKVVISETCPSNRLSRATGTVTLTDSAKLVVSNGARYCCKTLVLGDKTVTSGVITAEKQPDWIEGGGTVYVGVPGTVISLR